VGVLLLIGTRKGLSLIHGDDERRSFEVEGPLLSGWSINHAVLDPRDGCVYACANNWVYGGTVQRSDDLGKTWQRSEGLGLPEKSELKLASTWHLEPGHASEPGTLWLGGEPAVLFRSDDSGATWQPANQGTEACFLPEDRYPEVGQCVHKLLAHPGRPGRLWQQNHCGVYRSDDHGASWERLDGNGLPSGFGFGLALDPSDPDRAFVIPEEGAENRVTCDGRLGIYATADAGASWNLIVAEEPAWAAVLREGMSFDDEAVYAGTQSGHVYVLRHGEVVEAARHLPPIRALPVADLVLDEHGEVRSLVHVYVDGERVHDLTAPVGEKTRIRIVAAFAGG
jgi:photosystem II stability/assembly factor-like uncharacterized protein